MKLLVGLGNPGSRYENTRHNLGFMVLDELAQDLGFRLRKVKFKSLWEKTRIGSKEAVLLKPQEYMNNSGLAVREAADFFKIEPENIIIIYDDVDIELGRLRIRKNGSAGSHNGMRSVIQHLGSSDFPRIRMGIGRPPSYMDMADFVLARFLPGEEKLVEDMVLRGVEAARSLVTEDIDSAMNQFNRIE